MSLDFDEALTRSEEASQEIRRKDLMAIRRCRKRADSANSHSRGRISGRIDDLPVINYENQMNKDVIFGAYGVDEWAHSTHVHQAIISERSSIIQGGTWLTPAGWNLGDWIPTISTRYNFMSVNRAFAYGPWGLAEASVSRGKLEIEINGAVEEVKKFVALLDATFKRAENLIEWIYSPRGDSISVPLNYRSAVEGSYPWLPKDLNGYIDDYLNSDASVLILIGPPGTGKTTFIKNLIHRSGANAKVTYDETVMNGDGLFASFVEGEARFMIMEDADNFLNSRAEGNSMMHRFLNVSDGLISAKDKKLVFSTNLPSVRDIDSALLRPGRCFDIVEFRALTRKEALVITDKLGLSLRDGDSFTLAELFNNQPSEPGRMRKIGFT